MQADVEYINTEDALKRVGGNKGLYIKLLDQFVEGNHIGILEDYIAEGDMTNAAMAAHSIKGVGANLSLPKLTAAAASVEQKLKNGEDYAADLEEIKEIYDITVKQIEIVSAQ